MTYRELLAGNEDFRRLWMGQVVSEVGDWLNNIAVLALVIQLAGAGSVGLAIADLRHRAPPPALPLRPGRGRRR